MIVRIDIETGKVWENWLEYWEYWALAIGDGGVVGTAWDKLPEIEVDNLEEARKKMAYLYRKEESLTDAMKAYQITYNIMMNKIAQINKSRYDK